MKSIFLAIAVVLALVPAAIACPPVVVSSFGQGYATQSFGVQQFAAPVHCNAVAVQALGVQQYSSPVVVQQFVPFAVQQHHVAAFNVRQVNVHSARVNQRSVSIQRNGVGILGGIRQRLGGIISGGGAVRSRSVQIQSFQSGY